MKITIEIDTDKEQPIPQMYIDIIKNLLKDDKKDSSSVVPASNNYGDLLTRKQASEYLGVKETTLAIWKTNKRYKLPVVKVGRLVRYKKSDLDEFIEKRSTL